ncbi:MAG: DEAD/DEAH box helicase, partial [Planctomycetaceae bacterium]
MEPRHYQQQSHDAVWDFLRQESGSPLVVLPTGAGKSLVIAMLVEQARAFDARVIVLQHRKELIEQNAEKIQILLPDIKVGINSAGLRRHSFDDDVICAGIQSVYRKAHEFGRRELIIVDEAHLLSSSNDTMYGQFLADIRVINPRARLTGCTATPYRTGEGPICGKNKLFQRICYEAQTADLINEGFLCPITNKAALAQVDTSGIKTRGSEFIGHDMQRAFDTDDNVTAACSEIVEKCHDRHSVLCFASGVHHAESVAECLRHLTAETVGVVTGETIPLERSAHLANFRNGQLRWLVNCDVLTTGFDAPCIDAIAVLRATMSPGLFAQIVGRGLRTHESKTNCLAEGSRVLTDQGLIQIQDVTPDVKVWDGESFVTHGGAVCRGFKGTISYAGIECTPDHKLWTAAGWKTAEVCKANSLDVCVTGDGRTPIELGSGYIRNCIQERRSSETLHEDDLQTMSEIRNEIARRTEETSRWLPQMRQKTKQVEAINRGATLANYEMHFGETKMREFRFATLETIRRQGNRIPVQDTRCDGDIHSSAIGITPGVANRSCRQRWALRAGESKTGEADYQHEQSVTVKLNTHGTSVHEDVPGCSVCKFDTKRVDRQRDDVPRNHRTVLQPPVNQTQRRVWDIVNAGPRSRFTCEGLLVSNCVILDFGENIKRHGSLDDPEYGRASVSSRGENGGEVAERNGRGKVCLNCEIDVAANSRACPECGFLFPVKHESLADETSA